MRYGGLRVGWLLIILAYYTCQNRVWNISKRYDVSAVGYNFQKAPDIPFGGRSLF